jgi:hypothetical protein
MSIFINIISSNHYMLKIPSQLLNCMPKDHFYIFIIFGSIEHPNKTVFLPISHKDLFKK